MKADVMGAPADVAALLFTIRKQINSYSANHTVVSYKSNGERLQTFPIDKAR